MSQTIDNRIVELQFENKQFEQGVEESLSTLDKLKKSLKFDDASKNLEAFSRSTKNFKLDHISDNVDNISSKFSSLGAIGFTAFQRLTNAAIDVGKKIGDILTKPLQQIQTGGWNRAKNIDQAKFQLEGLGIAWSKIEDDINYGVQDTAYGLDAAAKAAAQLAASGVQVGKSMKESLLAISGVASMTSSTYEDISPIFTTIAGQGKVMTRQLRQLEMRGLNAAAVLAKALGKTESDVREMVSHGEISFEQFSSAMHEAFGKHAKDANKTFEGAMDNVKAALNKIGKEIFSPFRENMIPILNNTRLFINEIKSALGQTFKVSSGLMKVLSGFVSGKIASAVDFMHNRFTGLTNLNHALINIVKAAVRIVTALSDAFRAVFPETKNFGDGINFICELIELFTQKLILSDGALITFRNVMVVVFNVIKNIGSIFKFVVHVVKGFVSLIGQLVIGLGSSVSGLFSFVTGLDSVQNAFDGVKNAGDLVAVIIDKIKEAFSNLKNILTDTSTYTGQVVSKVRNVLETIGSALLVGLFTAIDKITGAFSSFNEKDPLGSIVQGVKNLVAEIKEIPVIGTVMSGIETVFDVVKRIFTDLVDLIVEFSDNINQGKKLVEAFDISLSSMLEKASQGFLDVVNKVKEFFGSKNKVEDVIPKDFTSKINNATSSLGTVKNALVQTKDKTKDVGVVVEETKDSIVNLGQEFSTVVKDELNSKMESSEKALEKVKNVIDKTKGKVGEYGEEFNKAQKSVTEFGHSSHRALRMTKESTEETTSSIEKAKESMTDFATNLNGSVTEEFGMRVNDAKMSIEGMSETLEKTEDGVKGATSAFEEAKKVISGFGQVIWEKLKNIKPSQIILMALSVVIIILATRLAKLADAFTGVAKSISNFINSGLKHLIFGGKKMSTFAENMLSTAAAIGVLAGSIWLLSKIPVKQMFQITGALGVLILMMGIFSLIGTKHTSSFAIAMVSFSTGILILIGALYALGKIENFDNIWLRVKILGVIIGAMLATSAILSRIAPRFSVGGVAILMFAGAIYILAKALEVVTNAKIGKLANREVWIGLSVTILSFAAFAGLASSVGIGAAIGLFSFLLIFNKLLAQASAADEKITKVKELLKDVVDKIKDGVAYVYNGLKKLTDDMEKNHGFAVTIAALFVGIIISLYAIGEAGRGILRMSFGFIAMAGAIALLMYVVVKIAELAQSVDPRAIKEATDILYYSLVFFGVMAGLNVIQEWVIRNSGHIFSNNRLLRDLRGMMFGLAAIFLSIGAFCALIGSLSAEEYYRAERILIATEAIVATIVIFSSVVAGLMGRSKFSMLNIGMSTFSGVIMLIGAFIAAIVGLMYFFEGIDWEKDKEQLLTVAGAIVLITIAVSVILGMIARLQASIKRTKLDALKLPLALTAIGFILLAVGAITLLVLKMSKKADTEAAIPILIGLGSFILALLTLVGILQFTTRKNLGTMKRQAAFMKTMASIGMLISGIVVLAGTFYLLKDVDPVGLAIQAGSLIILLAMLVQITEKIQRYAGLKRYMLSNKNVSDLMKTFGLLGILIGSIAVLAKIFYELREVDSPNLVGQAGALIILLAMLVQISERIVRYSGIKKYMLSEKNVADLMKTFGLLGILVGTLVVLAKIFYNLKKVDAGRMWGQTMAMLFTILALLGLITVVEQIATKVNPSAVMLGLGTLGLMIIAFSAIAAVFAFLLSKMGDPVDALIKASAVATVLLELLVIAYLCNALGRNAKQVALGGVLLLEIVSVFAILTLIFKMVEKLNPYKLLSKAESIVLVLFELGGIAAACIALGVPAFAALSGLGQVVLLAMVGIFAILVQIFKVISKLDPRNLLGKSQTIILVLVELVGIASLMGGLIIAMILGAVSAVALMPLIGAFAVLVQIFQEINKLNPNGLLEKSQIVVLVLLELIGISSLMGALIAALIAGGVGAAALSPLVSVFNQLVVIFGILQHIDVGGTTEKTDIIFKCLLKLIGIASLLGVVSVLALLSLAGIPSILYMCDALLMIATALNMLRGMAPGDIDKILDVFAETLLKLVGIGVLGLIGGPGLMLVAQAIILLGSAAELAGGGVYLFSRGMMNLAAIDASKLIGFFKGLKDGLLELTKLSPLVDFIAKSLMKLTFVGTIAYIGRKGLLALAVAITSIGAACWLAGRGAYWFVEAIDKLSRFTPDQIKNLQVIIKSFCDSIALGIVQISKGVKAALPIIAQGIAEFSNVIMDSRANIVLFIESLTALVAVGFISTLFAPGLIAFASALLIASIAAFVGAKAFSAITESMVLLGKMSPEASENMRLAISNFLGAITEGKAGLTAFINTLWGLVGIIAVAGLALTVFAPGFLVLTAVFATLTVSIITLTAAIWSFSFMSQERLQNVQNVILTVANSIATGIQHICQTILVAIHLTGQEIVNTTQLVISGVITAIISGGGLIFSAAEQMGAMLPEGFKLKAIEIVSSVGDIMQAFLSGIAGLIGSIFEAGKSMGSSLVLGFRTATGWWSPPEFEVNFFNDARTTAEKYGGVLSGVFKNVGEDSGSGMVKGLIDKAKSFFSDVKETGKGLVENIISGIDVELPDFFGRINAMGNAIRQLQNAAAQGFPSTIGDEIYKYENKLSNYKKGKAEMLRNHSTLEAANAKYDPLIDETNSKLEKYYEMSGIAARNTDILAESLNGAADSFGKAGGGAGKAADEMADFYGSLVDTLEGQMDIFSKFEKKEAMSKETLLENMRSQIQGMSEWAANMQKLAAKGIDQGLYEKLAMMGPQGAEYVAAFNEMTSAELMEANSLWAQSLVLPSAVSKQITSSFSGIGTNIMQGWIAGIDGNSEEYLTMLKTLAMQSHTIPEEELGIQSPSTVLFAIGAFMMLGLRDGINKNWVYPKAALKFVSDVLIAYAKAVFDPQMFYEIGVNLLHGLAAGLRDSGAIGDVLSAVSSITSKVESAATGPQGADTSSPSKKTKRLGEYLVEGLALGLRDPHGMASNAAADLANGAVDSMKATIAQVAKNLIEDDEFTPVITPVLDLTNVQSGARTLSNMFSANQALKASASINDLQNEQQNGSKFGTTFIQNNYSPKALNRMEIYRQTRNQFAQYREAML